MSDFKKYIIGVIAFCVFCKCPLLFFIGAGIAIVWWLISNVVLEQEVENKLNRGEKK